MYRLTIDSASVPKRVAGVPQTMRVYKWEDKTGYFLPDSEKWDAAWMAEQRAPVGHGPGWLLETVIQLSASAPPPLVDDVWSEEVIVRGNVISGNLTSIVGNEKIIAEYAVRAGIKLPASAFPAVLPPLEAEEPLSIPSTERAVPLPPPAPLVTRPPQLLPRPPHPESSRAHATHPGSHGSRTGEHHLPGREHQYAHRPAHTGPRPYARPAGPGPAFRGQYPPRSELQRPGTVHNGEVPRHYAPRPTGPSQRAQVCLVVEE